MDLTDTWIEWSLFASARERKESRHMNMDTLPDTRIVKSILAAGALNALVSSGADVGADVGDTNKERILQNAVKIADRLMALLFPDALKG
jgi:hypothetical protein